MKTKLIFILILSAIAPNSFAQKKTFADSLSNALNAIIIDLPNNCKNLCGEPFEGSKDSYKSKIILPRSTHNRFDVATFINYPIIFMSYLPASKNQTQAIVRQKEIDKAIQATVINFKGKKYKIEFLTVEVKNGGRPDYQYKIQNPPTDLADARLYIRLDYVIGHPDELQFTMGIYVKK